MTFSGGGYFCLILLILIGKWLKGTFRINTTHLKIVGILTVLMFLKYIVPNAYENIVPYAAVMDGKWYVYFIIAVFSVAFWGLPSIDKTWNAARFFCIIYIAKALYMILTGQLSRSGVLLEANYDGFMILTVYCFRNKVCKRKKYDDLIFLSATFLTLSRTGIIALFAIWLYKVLRKNIFLLIPIIPIGIAIVYVGVMLRGEDSVGHLDRFVYWQQAFLYFDSTSLANLLLGHTPGQSLKMFIMPEFAWTVDTFEEMRHLRGVFPFMFHSAYLRIVITWGIPAVIALLLYLIRKFITSKNETLRLLIILILVQSFSLSTLTLPNVSLLLFLAFMMALHGEKTNARTIYSY